MQINKEKILGHDDCGSVFDRFIDGCNFLVTPLMRVVQPLFVRSFLQSLHAF